MRRERWRRSSPPTAGLTSGSGPTAAKQPTAGNASVSHAPGLEWRASIRSPRTNQSPAAARNGREARNVRPQARREDAAVGGALGAHPGQCPEERGEPGRAHDGDLDQKFVVGAAHRVFAAVERRMRRQARQASRGRGRPESPEGSPRVLSTGGRGEAWGGVVLS